MFSRQVIEDNSFGYDYGNMRNGQYQCVVLTFTISNIFLLEFCGDLKDLVDDLDQVDRLGDIDMEPMDLLGTNATDNFDLFAEIEKYENSATSTNLESSLSLPLTVTPPTASVPQVRSSVIVGRPQPQPQPQPQPLQPQQVKPPAASKTTKILPGEVVRCKLNTGAV